MTPTYSRYDDHSRKAREITEYTDRNGAPYYEKVQGMLREHYKQSQPYILLRDLQTDLQEEIQPMEREVNF